ncbi:MAG: peptidoglycan-binding protein [Parcubacteria group bacterium]|jgi:pimeloyl-ACP methyl ester carboxylesterase
MKKILSRGVSVILIVSIIFSPLHIACIDFLQHFVQVTYADDLEDLSITEMVTWNSDTDLSMYNTIYAETNAIINIEPGSTIKIRNLILYENAIINAVGTSEKPITITQLPINAVANGEYDAECIQQPAGTISLEQDPLSLTESIFSYVTFENMGTYIDMSPGNYNCPAMVRNDRIFPSLAKTAYAAKPAEYYDPYDNDPIKSSPAVYYESGRVTMTNCTFKNNEFADVLVNMEIYEDADRDNHLTIKNSNFGENKKNIAVRSRVVDMNRYYEYFDERYALCLATFPPGYQWWEKYEYCSLRATGEADDNEMLFDDGRVTLTNNWYGHENGPDTSHIEWGGQGDRVYGNLTLDGFRLTPDMASNVLFLPGIKASRLYKERSVLGVDKLWPPNNYVDVDDLMLDDDGESMKNVFTEDVIDEIGAPIVGGNIYKSFVGDLQDMKDESVIADFSTYAYDWRYDMQDIVQNGTAYPSDETKNVISEIERLAQSSISGKVTIVAHSMGGLLTKAAMQELERQGKSALVDTIVLVDSPQMGTPQAIPALLHGYDEGLPIPGLMSDFQARKFAENMSSAYGLLPSKEYFDRTEEPVIDFDTALEPYKKYKDAYGNTIGNFTEFRDFALGKKDDREKPDVADLVSANILNEKLFDKAADLHDHIDAWTPSEDIKVIQIGGWGLDTMRGVTYTTVKEKVCTEEWSPYVGEGTQRTCEIVDTPNIEPQFTVDGDAVVTTPSSLMLPIADNIEKYWVDLFDKNYGLRKNREHKDILEVESVRGFISEIIKTHKSPEVLPQYISTKRPDDSAIDDANPRIRMSLYSPLDIHLYDEHGNHTGPVTTTLDGEEIISIEENIPNSYYAVLGEHKYVGWGTDDDVRVELDGYGSGSYTVNVQEIHITDTGEREGDSTTFEHLPTSADMIVSFTVPRGGIADMSDFTADYDGDGTIDYTITPQINSSATLEEKDHSEPDDDADADTENTTEEQPQKASIDSWKAYQYMTQRKSCPIKLILTLNGKHFDKDGIIRIGDVKGKDIKRDSHRKITATFCMKDLQRAKTNSLKTISIENPDTKRDKADKKIDITKIPWKITAEEIRSANVYTPEGIIVIQKALNSFGYMSAGQINDNDDEAAQKAIMQFQKDHDLPQTGFCGEMTKKKIIEDIKK